MLKLQSCAAAHLCFLYNKTGRFAIAVSRFFLGLQNAPSGASRSPKGGGVRRILIFMASILFFGVCSTASADIYSWTDENGIRHFTNSAPPRQAKIIQKIEELPHDQQADHERVETERLDQLTAALQTLAEKEAELAEMQLTAEKRVEAANRKAQEALDQAESLLNEAQHGPYGHGSSGYGYYPYKHGYNQSIYDRWYYHHSGSISYKKRHYKYRHKHDDEKKYHSQKRHGHKYRGFGHRRYEFRTHKMTRRLPAIRGGSVHRSGFGHRHSLGVRSFSLNR